jgi:hypothetical protein
MISFDNMSKSHSMAAKTILSNMAFLNIVRLPGQPPRVEEMKSFCSKERAERFRDERKSFKI